MKLPKYLLMFNGEQSILFQPTAIESRSQATGATKLQWGDPEIYSVSGIIVSPVKKEFNRIEFNPGLTWDGGDYRWCEDLKQMATVETIRFYGSNWRSVIGETQEDIIKGYLLALL